MKSFSYGRRDASVCERETRKYTPTTRCARMVLYLSLPLLLFAGIERERERQRSQMLPKPEASRLTFRGAMIDVAASCARQRVALIRVERVNVSGPRRLKYIFVIGVVCPAGLLNKKKKKWLEKRGGR